MKRLFLALAILAGLGVSAPASAQDQTVMSTVTVAPDAPEGLVYKVLRGPDAVAMPSLQGQPGVSCNVTACMNTFTRNRAYLAGAEICISNTGANWSLRPDGTFDESNPARRPFCAPISATGAFTITAPLRQNATPYIVRTVNGVRRAVAWVDRRSLVGITNFTSFE